MNLTDFALRNRTIILVLTLVAIYAGTKAFNGLPRLEDPEFTIKEALVITPYPGATAYEVEEEVSDELELAIQKLGKIKRLESRNTPGQSTITVGMRCNLRSMPACSTSGPEWRNRRREVVLGAGFRSPSSPRSYMSAVQRYSVGPRPASKPAPAISDKSVACQSGNCFALSRVALLRAGSEGCCQLKHRNAPLFSSSGR